MVTRSSPSTSWMPRNPSFGQRARVIGSSFQNSSASAQPYSSRGMPEADPRRPRRP